MSRNKQPQFPSGKRPGSNSTQIFDNGPPVGTISRSLALALALKGFVSSEIHPQAAFHYIDDPYFDFKAATIFSAIRVGTELREEHRDLRSCLSTIITDIDAYIDERVIAFIMDKVNLDHLSKQVGFPATARFLAAVNILSGAVLYDLASSYAQDVMRKIERNPPLNLETGGLLASLIPDEAAYNKVLEDLGQAALGECSPSAAIKRAVRTTSELIWAQPHSRSGGRVQ